MLGIQILLLKFRPTGKFGLSKLKKYVDTNTKANINNLLKNLLILQPLKNKIKLMIGFRF